jgi:hypothetical protein
MEIPEQYQLVRSLRLMDRTVGEKYLKRLHLKGQSTSPSLSLCCLLTSLLDLSLSRLSEIPCVGPPLRAPTGGLSLDTNAHSRSFRNQSSSVSPERRRASHSTPMSHAPSPPRALPSFSSPSNLATDPPSDYLCPISHEVNSLLFCLFLALSHLPQLMMDPVIAQDGFTYERKAIEMWFRNGNDSSPMTNEPLPSLLLIPNNNLKSQVASWNDSRRRH